MTIRSAVIADDEFLNRDLMEEILGRLDIKVRSAKDGVAALRLLEDEPADLLMSDIRMPGMGGLKLLHKAKEKWPAMPVVMMTAYASVESAIESMRQGAYDYLMKPFGVEQVEALLLRLNERQQLLREVVMLREKPAIAIARETFWVIPKSWQTFFKSSSAQQNRVQRCWLMAKVVPVKN